MFSKLINFLDHSYARNVAFTFLIGVFCIVLGSASTALFLVASIAVIFFNPKISIKAVWQQTLDLIIALPILLIFPMFFITVFITSIRGENWLTESVFVAGSYWQFLIILPASIGLYHLSKDINFAGIFTLGCRFGLIFVVPLSLAQIYFFNLRPEGFLSNSLIFASLCIAGAGIALTNWPEDTHKGRMLSWIVFSAGIVAALLTFSRGMLVAIAVIIAIALLYYIKSKSKYKPNIKMIAVISASIFAIFATLLQTNNGWRILNNRILKPIEMLSQGQLEDHSINHRLDMQVTGFNAFLERPLVGHGIQNSVEVANELSEEVLGRVTNYTYTHLHNDYLTHAVGGGVLLFLLFVCVILSPLILSWKLQKTEDGTSLFYYGLMLSGAYFTIAMTNIVFHNDQLTTMFCAATIFIVIRFVQNMHDVHEVRIPDLQTIANGINPIGLTETSINSK